MKKPVTKSVNKGKKTKSSDAQIHLEDDMLPNELLDSTNENVQQHSSASAQQNMEQNQPAIVERSHICEKKTVESVSLRTVI